MRALLSLWVALSACAPQPAHELAVASHVPVTRPLVDSVEIVPPVDHEGATLGSGWPGSLVGEEDEAEGDAEDEEGTWRIRGRVATFTFQVATVGDRVMEMEIRAQGNRDDPEQTIYVHVNEEPLEPRPLAPRWSIEEFRIPASALHVGVNEIRLEFEWAQRPPGAPEDVAPVPARVRWVRLRPPLDRPPWPRPPVPVALLEVEASEPPESSVPTLEMRTDSLLELLLPLRPDARLEGTVEAEFVRGSRSGEIRAVVEALGTDGVERHLAEYRFTHGDGGQGLDVELDPAWGDEILLRFRVQGSANGRVRWSDLRVLHGGSVISEPVGDPDTELRAAPATGALAPQRQGDRPADVLVILLDAARADAFGPWGAERPTPAVAALAAEGTRVERAIAPSSWTEPSVPSLLTGLYPDVHGVEIWNWPLAQEIETLPEILGAAGYRTVLWSHHLLWRGNLSLHQGFEVVETVSRFERELLPDPTLLVDDDRPTFALVHLLLPHNPYEAPAPFRDRYADPDRNLVASGEVLASFRNRFSDREPSPELIAHARDRYDEMVAWTDAQVATLLDGLRELERYDDTWIILTADHGEGFYEHGQFLHARFLYDEVLHVPLIFKWPAGFREAVDSIEGPVSLIDLPPTVLDALGISAGETRFQGRSLMPALTGDPAADSPDSVYAVTRVTELAIQEPRPQLILERDGLKVYLDEPTGRVELYDLRADPGETLDLARSRLLDTARMLQALLTQRRRNNVLRRQFDTGTEAFELDPEMIENLRALGYLQ